MNNLLAILCALLCVALVVRWSRGFSGPSLFLANIAEGTHDRSLSKYADAALTTRHLVVKAGSDADHVAICGAGDLPLGTVPDEVATADLTLQRVEVELLGIGISTRLAVASEAIALTDELYTAADGKVQDKPTAAGTYYKIGTPVSTASGDGVLIEFIPCEPRKLTVIAALGSLNGALAALTSSAQTTQAEFNAAKAEWELLGDDVRAIATALSAGGDVAIATS